MTLQFLERIAKFFFFLSIVHISELFSKSCANAFLDLLNALLTRQFFSNRKSFVQIFMSNLINARIKLISILWEKLEFLSFLRCNTLQLILSIANYFNKRLSSFQTTSNNFLIRLSLTFIVNQSPSVLTGTCFNHCNSYIAIFNHSTCNNNLENSTLTLTPTWERNPLTVNQRQTDTRNWTFKWQTRNHSRCRCSIQCDYIVCIVRIYCQNCFNNLNFIT